MIDMNDAFRFAASCSSPRELIARLQFGMTELWPQGAAIPVRWHYMADMIDSERGLLVELDGAVSSPVADVLAATAELCRQSATEAVPQLDWALLRRAAAWLDRSCFETDRALLSVAEEVALTGLDGVEPDFSVVSWLCLEMLAQFEAGRETIDYWVERANLTEPSAVLHRAGSVLERDERNQLSVAV
ncbi:hypothetical protein CH256_14525 [Rhodococcus sp. 05-2254-6]|nr:hypothetical protein CH256_14525 [Rhodococcus sp. 05-2254-6]OZE32910.1 hypothetical protein CH259_20925 [Rhodococcus sp. 05-2254-4]OZE44196.1 hypothetical protein CH261_17730 [Rhodococcus sp. 05-2254-3]OZE56124.1 hypothetical protein CH283_01190 [Rhodococcus sp. 05-2254-2]